MDILAACPDACGTINRHNAWEPRVPGVEGVYTRVGFSLRSRV